MPVSPCQRYNEGTKAERRNPPKEKKETLIVTAATIANRHLGVQRTAAIEISVRRYDMSANKRETMMEIEKARCVFRCGEPYF